MKKFFEKLEWLLGLGGTTKDIVLLSVSFVAVVLSLVFSYTSVVLPFDIAWVSIVLCGLPIVLEAIIGLVTRFDIKADVLVSIAIIASICIGEIFAAGEVAFIMQLGGLLEELTVKKARAGIERLVRLTPQTARRLQSDGSEKIVPAEQVVQGDILRVFPGETIPVDGVVVKGQTSVNQAVMTGESLPVDKMVGDEVSSGTVNQYGSFDMRATKVGEDSSIQRMIKLVQTADAGKAKIVRLADRWATWIVVIALAAAVVTWIITGEIIRAVTILVVFCPCALVLATPTAIMAAIGNVSKHGFLVREGDALERLAKVKVIAFDKTGTLTYGTPEVIAAKTVGPKYTDADVYALAAAAEQFSEHPLGKAVVRCYGKHVKDADGFEMLAGKGVRVRCEGETISVGNHLMLADMGVEIPDGVDAETAAYVEKGCTVVYVISGKDLAGYVALSDTVREESAAMIEGLLRLGVTPVLLTGDNKRAASSIAHELKISEVKAECFPEDKLNAVAEMEAEGRPVCMMGDGINDAPALKRSTVGIAMGGVGSDIAMDAADIVLVDDEVKELPHLLAISKRMMLTIKINLVFSMTLNFVAIILAILGILNPVVGALVHNAGSVLVVVNSALLLGWKKKTI